MKPFFNGDSYETPLNTTRMWGDMLALKTRWFFVAGYVNEIIKARSLALKGLYTKDEWAKSSYNIMKVIEGCGGRFQIRGLANLQSCTEPVVFVSNHMSTLETFVLPCIIAPVMDVTFIVKESLTKHFLFGPVMRSRDPITVGRQNPREDLQTVMSKGKEILFGGSSLIVFPQTTRTVEFIPREFNSLGIKLAKSAGVKVLPVAIKTDFWKNGRFIKEVGAIDRSKTILMSFGQPLSIQGVGKAEHNMILDFISTNLREWGVCVHTD